MSLGDEVGRGETKEFIDGYKLYYVRKNNTRNEVGIVVDKDLKEKIVGLKRLGDKIITIKLVLEEDIMNTISACAPHARLDENVKRQFWEEMDGLI